MPLQLDDLIASYPPNDTPQIQTIISGKKEFLDVSSYPEEPPPEKGDYYNNQKFLLRYMISYDRIIVTWETGTGKTCGVAIIAEHYHDLHLKYGDDAPIQKTIVLTRGPSLKNDFRMQIACRCAGDRYLTKQVLEATKEKTRKGNLKRAVDQWYTIETYTRFLIGLEKLTDDEVRKQYSRIILFIDEAHNLNIDLEVERQEKTKQRLYTQLHRLCHLTEGSKIIAATATPMVENAKEIAPLMNLLLPSDHQLPADWNYDTVSIEQMEPYLRGRVSFVRALDTGINITYEGESLDITYNTVDGEITSELTLETGIMGDIQTEGFLRAQEIKSGVYGNERQASNFVFPDYSWGGSFVRDAKTPEQTKRFSERGLGKWVTSVSADNYIATDEFREWLVDIDLMSRLSSKYSNTIRAVSNGTLGTVFVYNDFVYGSGAIVHGLCFEAQGYDRYKGDKTAFRDIGGAALPPICSSQVGTRDVILEKYPRYALLTSETPHASQARIIELFNSPENIHGEYLKVIIGSEITREGISLNHVTQTHLITTWWNLSANYQALSRSIRSTSHIYLLDEERERLKSIGEDPNTASVPVSIYRHAALPDVEDPYVESTDVYMYRLAEQKGYNIKRMDLMTKRIATDCQIHQARNIKEGEEYTCYDPIPEKLDLSTYDVYYLDNDIKDATQEIMQLFTDKFTYLRPEIYSLLKGFRRTVVDRALVDIIVNRRVINDRYGFPSYLQEDGNRYFLQRDFPLLSTFTQDLVAYTSNLISGQEVSIPTYLTSLDAEEQLNIQEEILTLPPDSPDYEPLMDSLSTESLISLFETLVYQYVMEGADSPIIMRVIEDYKTYLYSLFEPIRDIEDVEAKLTTKSKRGPGRPSKKGTSQKKKITIKPDQLKEEIVTVALDEVPNLIDSDIVLIHTLHGLGEKRVSYTVSTAFRKGASHLRILKLNENEGWRDLLPSEVPVYNAIIEKIRSEQIKDLEDVEIYGTLLQDGKFRIRDKTTEKVILKQGTGELDKRSRNNGRICTNFNKGRLIEIIWKLQMPQPEEESIIIPQEKEDLIRFLLRKDTIKNDSGAEDWDINRLYYYALWETYGTKEDICNAIHEFLEKEKKILYH